MKRSTILFAVLFALVAVGPAEAAIVLNDSELQTVDFRDFTFAFDPVLVSDGVTDATFVPNARGDYTIRFPGIEFAVGTIETVFVAGGPAPAHANWHIRYGYDDAGWEKAFAVGAAGLSAVTANSAVRIDVDLSNEVCQLSCTDFLDVALSYKSMPEPASLIVWSLMIALTWAGGGWRFFYLPRWRHWERKAQAAQRTIKSTRRAVRKDRHSLK